MCDRHAYTEEPMAVEKCVVMAKFFRNSVDVW